MRLFLVFFAIAIGIMACKTKNNDANSDKTAISTSDGFDAAPADFKAFYEQFHKDSLFQWQHITFPLHGFPDGVDSLTYIKNNFVWEKEDWTMHKPFVIDGKDFTRELTIFSPDLITERIHQPLTKHSMERRFARFDNGKDWYLIYYVGMNPIKN